MVLQKTKIEYGIPFRMYISGVSWILDWVLRCFGARIRDTTTAVNFSSTTTAVVVSTHAGQYIQLYTLSKVPVLNLAPLN